MVKKEVCGGETGRYQIYLSVDRFGRLRFNQKNLRIVSQPGLNFPLENRVTPTERFNYTHTTCAEHGSRNVQHANNHRRGVGVGRGRSSLGHGAVASNQREATSLRLSFKEIGLKNISSPSRAHHFLSHTEKARE
jgi:hypothetical protein